MCSGVDLGVYAALGMLQALMVLGASFALAIGGIIGSRRLHDGMLHNILRSPMSFFDTTPLGRILNRFSKVIVLITSTYIHFLFFFYFSQDIYTIDEIIPFSLRGFIMTFLSVVSTIIVIAIASPWFLGVIVPLLVFYTIIQVLV